MSQSKPPPLDLELITSLAKQFVERNLFDEAAAFFRIAQRLDPDDLGIRLSLAQVRSQLRARRSQHREDLDAALREQHRRNSIDAFQFFGLGALYEERGQLEQAAQCLEIAHGKGTVNPFLHKLRGKILLRQRRFDAAAEALGRARRYNPFDRGLAELASRAEYQREHYAEALEAAIDAFWLLRHDDPRSHKLKKRIRTLKVVLGLEHDDLIEVFRKRRERLQTAFERLEWHREQLLHDDGLDPDGDSGSERQADTEEPDDPAADTSAGRIDLAARLRRFDSLEALDDVEIFQLTETVHAEHTAPGAIIFRHLSDGSDLYLIEHGAVRIQRTTSYGIFPLGTVPQGELLGEVGFVSREPRSADALAEGACTLLRIDSEELEALIGTEPDLGLKLYRTFWRALSQKLRQSNEQLGTFFSQQQTRGHQPEPPLPDRVDVGSADKIRLLREQGLSGRELTTLATFSDVKRFGAGATLFREGDPGAEMYVVLEGKVMISKFIPGGGEEALAILERGDFFGEMSLIDHQPRSADAKAHEGPATVIAFDEDTLREVLSMDSSVALELMQLLCRLISKRLREIDEKLTTWRIMAGARDLESAAVPEPTVGG